MPSNEPVGFIAFVVGLLTLIAGTEVAHLIGPYAGIVLAAFAGAGLALNSSDERFPWYVSIRYLLTRAFVAVVLGVALAKILHNGWPDADTGTLVIPIAFLIGFIKDYRALLLWCRRCIKFLRSVKVRVGDTKGPHD